MFLRLHMSSTHHRLEPYLTAPSPGQENTDSPPGPLQNDIKKPSLADWCTIDWVAVVASTPTQEADTSNAGVSWTTATATGLGDALIHSGRDFGGYGFLCLLPCFIACSMQLRLRLLLLRMPLMVVVGR